jgi:hypothetical protein
VDIATDLEFIGGAVKGDKLTGVCPGLRRLTQYSARKPTPHLGASTTLFQLVEIVIVKRGKTMSRAKAQRAPKSEKHQEALDLIEEKQ